VMALRYDVIQLSCTVPVIALRYDVIQLSWYCTCDGTQVRRHTAVTVMYL